MEENNHTNEQRSQDENFITFKLDQELFAIDVAHVREVLDLPELTRVPSSPPYMRGVVNVRGVAIPVVDLRLKFGMPGAKDTVHTRVLVMEIELDGEHTTVGGLADSVHNVVELNTESIGPSPKIASSWRTDLIQGMGKIDNHFVMILDADKVFASDDLPKSTSQAVNHSKEEVMAV